MILQALTTTFIGILTLACGDIANTANREKRADSTSADTTVPSSDDQASNQLYLDDMEESAAEDSPADEPEDSSVESDTRADRLAQIADHIMDKLDADESGDLSLDEFLSRAKERAEKHEMDAEKKQKMLDRLTADFKKFAGDDEKLSKEELIALLKEIGPRIGRHRHCHHRGEHGMRIRRSWEDTIAKFDADGDGKINKEEFEALRSELRSERRERFKRFSCKCSRDEEEKSESDGDDDDDGTKSDDSSASQE